MNNPVLVLGDIHLGRSMSVGRTGIGSSLNSRIIDQINLLDWVLDQAIEHNIKHIITTGDVFEELKVPPYLIALLIEWIKRCEIHNIHIHIVIGNHDILRTGTHYTSPLDILSSSELENVSIYKNIETIFIEGTAFTFIPFRDRRSFGVETYGEAIQTLQNMVEYELVSIPITYRKVVVGHLSLEGSIPIGDEIDDISNELMLPLNMFNGYNYVLMGHVHRWQVLREQPHIVHLGSMDISNFGESDQIKKIAIIHPQEDKEIEYVNIPTRPLKKLNISVPKDTKNTTQYVIDEIQKYSNVIDKAIVRLDVHLTSPDLVPINRAEVEKVLYALHSHNVASISESKKMNTIVKNPNEVINNTIDVNSAIKMYSELFIEQNNRSNFISAATDIYAQFREQEK